MLSKTLATAALLVFALTAHADDDTTSLDSASLDAMKQTQALLNNSEQRKDAMKGNAAAAQADQQVRKLAGSDQNANDIYGLSSDIFASMVKNSAGDSSAMQKALDAAAKDPEGFMRSLSPEQQKKLEEISKHITGGATK